ncbi:MAG: kinase/pyrophosphorylase, partial [Paraclostridium sp.]
MENLTIYVISDSVGETAQQVTKAAMSQYSINADYEIRRFPYVVEKSFLEDILKSAKSENALVIYTLVEEELLNLTEEFCKNENLSCVDLMTPLLKEI